MTMLEDCVAALSLGFGFVKAGNAKSAPSVFDDVIREAANLDAPAAREAEVVAHYGASCLAAALKQEDERNRRLAEAAILARKLPAPSDMLDSVDLLADALMSMGESQLAIPYCNQAVALTSRNASAAGGRLWRAGRCYLRAGFPRDAQAPLRDAVEIMRKAKSHPGLPFALLDLGNAFLQSDPVQAEACFGEAAELWAAANRENQAATAWLNLGVLCSRAGRLDEALGWYEKVLKSREADPGATVSQRGNIHNNNSSVWRKKGDFVRARAEIDHAIQILSPEGGAALANAFGTFAEICRDEERHDDAFVWFRRAREEFERQPSPSVDQLVTKLENEATALEQLGRTGESAEVREKVASLRARSVPVSPSIPADVKASVSNNDEAEASVIVTLDGLGLGDEVYAKFDLATLERRLETRLEQTGEGELDGHEFGPESTQLFLYGQNARTLFDAIAPVLRAYPLCRGARVELRERGSTSEFLLEERGPQLRAD
jgi:tetratricopeptide (TPR) repeat protein